MKRLALTTLALAVSAALIVGAPAIAGGPDDPVGGEQNLGVKGGLKYLAETLEVGSSGHFGEPYEAAWIACGTHGSKWKPSAGGGRLSGTSVANFLAATRPMDLDAPFENPPNTVPDDWWDTTVRSVLGRELTGYTICTMKPLRYVRTSTPDSPSGERTGSSQCPTGRTLVGGGAFIATTDSYINASYPGPRNTWKVRIYDTVGGSGGMESYAICRKAKGATVTSKATKNLLVGVPKEAVAKCGPAKHVIGGGGRLSGLIGEAHLAASFPIDGPDQDTTPDDGWKVIGYNGAGGAKSLRAYAVCVAKG